MFEELGQKFEDVQQDATQQFEDLNPLQDFFGGGEGEEQ